MFIKIFSLIITTTKSYEEDATELLRQALDKLHPKKKRIGFINEEEENDE